MRKGIASILFLLGGCSTMAPAEPDYPVRGETPGRTCRDAGLDRFVGRPANEALGGEILAQSGAATLRWIPHGSAVTMDFRPDRVNVRLDERNMIESVTCG